MQRFKIIGTGSFLPPRVVTNDELSKTVDTSDAWIRERSGIGERRFTEGDVATSDLAAEAIRRACADADMDPAELDGIILGTCSPDTTFPATACWTQEKLGVRGMPAFDVMAGCTSWLYGLKVASHWVAGNPKLKVAVVGAENFSKILDFQDRRTCVLFGDGAGAGIVTGTTEDCGFLASNWGSDGEFAPILQVPAGGSREPASAASVDGRRHYLEMHGAKVFKHAVRSMSSSLIDALAEAEVAHEDVDLLIPHQANIRIMDACRERTKIPADRVFSVLEKYGNLSAASIPVALDEARRAGIAADGQLLAVTAFGGGFTWGAGVLRL